ncbi:MAG: type II toxin-antitoxin system VapC family toxin [Planctomycetes bacterium]|nr:type II toxin-antitoxin system VapC family toxin [Planctomycetota bacterium]
MILYLDTSAVVKRFLREPFDQVVNGLIRRADVVGTSRIAYAEVCSAMARSCRAGRLTSAEFKAAMAEFEASWRDMATVELEELRAGQLALRHPLRGFDAVHLAAAMRLRAGAGDEPVAFCTFDVQQGKAARAEGFEVLPEPKPVKDSSRLRRTRLLRR